MSRKDFLKHMVAFLVSLIGISALIKNLTNPSIKSQSQPSGAKKSSDTFGGGAYGG